jgi:hypothetical protein
VGYSLMSRMVFGALPGIVVPYEALNQEN